MFCLTNKLRIGFYEEVDYFPCTPGVRRAIRVAKEKLEALGHELVPFVPPRIDYVVSSVISMFTRTKADTYWKLCKCLIRTL